MAQLETFTFFLSSLNCKIWHKQKEQHGPCWLGDSFYSCFSALFHLHHITPNKNYYATGFISDIPIYPAIIQLRTSMS